MRKEICAEELGPSGNELSMWHARSKTSRMRCGALEVDALAVSLSEVTLASLPRKSVFGDTRFNAVSAVILTADGADGRRSEMGTRSLLLKNWRNAEGMLPMRRKAHDFLSKESRHACPVHVPKMILSLGARPLGAPMSTSAKERCQPRIELCPAL